MAIAAAAFVAVIAPTSAQDSKLKAAMVGCLTAAANGQPEIDTENPEVLIYTCEGGPAAALLAAMKQVSKENFGAWQAGSIVCRSKGLTTICTFKIETTTAFATQAR
jgi:hypothetical protein